MSEENNTDVFAKIEEKIRDSQSGDNLKNALGLVAYLRESGRTCKFGAHPEFYYMGEFTCLIVCEEFLVCCWEGECDLYEPDGFPVDDSLKEFARANVVKCFGCGGCDGLGPVRRTVFGKEYDGACCNIFHFHSPDGETLEKIIKLMELQKYMTANSKE